MNRIKANQGFTLIELLIVMVIVGLLASLVAPQMFGKVDDSRIKTAQTQMRMLETSISTYRLDLGAFPANLDVLLSSDNERWQGPYFPEDIPVDPWGNDYVYKMPGEEDRPYTLKSLGPDGQEGNDDIYLRK
ncbi:MAG TPA: type II secretion system major pseudopilin GspG [Pseudidiomarina sp.]|nr:type II secretion system major pseudopilin GspG [Pseudidiomarina sp.]